MEGENSTFLGPSWKLYNENFPQFAICFFGVVSHSLLLYAFCKDPLNCFKNSGIFLVINLTLSDLLMCLVGPVYASVNHDAIDIGFKTVRFIAYALVAVSILTISSISIDRFLLVAYPIKHSYLMKGKVLIIWPACIWLIGITIPAKEVIFGKQSYDSIALSCFIAIVVVFSAVMYALTYVKLRKQSRNMQALESSVGSRAQKTRILKEKQFLRTIVIIACVAVICIVPATVFRNPFFDKIKILRYISFGMLYMNFSLNPLIYILRLPNYRKTFYLLYCRRR